MAAEKIGPSVIRREKRRKIRVARLARVAGFLIIVTCVARGHDRKSNCRDFHGILHTLVAGCATDIRHPHMLFV
jgi:hypothetical protein